MPRQIGFVTGRFMFQTALQGFYLSDLGGRLVLATAVGLPDRRTAYTRGYAAAHDAPALWKGCPR